MLQLHIVFDMSNEADIITSFLAIKTRFTIIMIPLLMW